MVHLEGVMKRFGVMTALRGVDLQLKRGRCLGIFGPNGAGKTTLFNISARDANSAYLELYINTAMDEYLSYKRTTRRWI